MIYGSNTLRTAWYNMPGQRAAKSLASCCSMPYTAHIFGRCTIPSPFLTAFLSAAPASPQRRLTCCIQIIHMYRRKYVSKQNTEHTWMLRLPGLPTALHMLQHARRQLIAQLRERHKAPQPRVPRLRHHSCICVSC